MLTHGGIGGLLSFTTVLSYLIAALAKYTESDYECTQEMWIVMAVYVVMQFGAALVGLHYIKDTIMYLVAGELKDICETYGALCGQLGVMEPNSDFEEVDGTSLQTWVWDD